MEIIGTASLCFVEGCTACLGLHCLFGSEGTRLFAVTTLLLDKADRLSWFPEGMRMQCFPHNAAFWHVTKPALSLTSGYGYWDLGTWGYH